MSTEDNWVTVRILCGLLHNQLCTYFVAQPMLFAYANLHNIVVLAQQAPNCCRYASYSQHERAVVRAPVWVGTYRTHTIGW